jgi:hypothetical protein
MDNRVMAIATVFYVALTAAVVWIMHIQTTAQTRTVKLQMFNMLAARMENARQHRQVVRDYASKCWLETGRVVFPLPDNVRDAADRVCREFDYLGLIDRNRIVDPKLIDQFYAVPFVQLYEDVLQTYVDDLRKPENRGPAHFWELVQLYERVKNVPRNHPGLGPAVKPDWPNDARA